MAAMARLSIQRSMLRRKSGMRRSFSEENISGIQTETWQHVGGCRMWLLVERDTMTHDIHAVRPAHPGMAKALETSE